MIFFINHYLITLVTTPGEILHNANNSDFTSVSDCTTVVIFELCIYKVKEKSKRDFSLCTLEQYPDKAINLFHLNYTVQL